MSVWLIDAGVPGHTVQVAGVGRILERQTSARTEWLHCQSRVRGIMRGIARWVTEQATTATAPKLAHWLHRELKLPEGKPDVIVASCGDSAYLTRLLGVMTGAVTVFIGEVKPFPAEWFDLVVLPTTTSLPNGITAPLMETGQSKQGAAAAAAAYWPQGVPASCWSILIGGESRSHGFEKDDWQALAREMNRLAEEHSIRWLVTTSRRTGAEAETILRETLEPSVMEDAVWWSQEPKKSVAAFLHAGERVFVTRDSLTMISEAIAVKEQIETIYPAHCRIAPHSIMEGYLSLLERTGRMRAHAVTWIRDGAIEPPEQSIEEEQEKFSAQLVARIQDLMKRNTMKAAENGGL